MATKRSPTKKKTTRKKATRKKAARKRSTKKAEPKRERGRPREVMSPEEETRLVRIVSTGPYVSQAARALGLPESTVRMHKSRNPDFAERLEQAEAACENGWLARALKAARSDARVLIQLLERRFPARWGKQDRLPVDEDGDTQALTNEQRAARLKRLLEEVHNQGAAQE